MQIIVFSHVNIVKETKAQPPIPMVHWFCVYVNNYHAAIVTLLTGCPFGVACLLNTTDRFCKNEFYNVPPQMHLIKNQGF